jgi:spermidine synthase
MFEIPFESDTFQIVEADGAQYIKILRGSTDVILVDGFDDTQIVDALVEESFFIDCHKALHEKGIFITNWWSGDKRYNLFVDRLKTVFPYVLEIPAESHGNSAVMATKTEPTLQLDALKKRALNLRDQYGLDFIPMYHAIKANNHHNDKKLVF